MTTMANILLNPQVRWKHVKAVAAEMAKYPLAQGLTLDYEFMVPHSKSDLDQYAKIGGLTGLQYDQVVDSISSGYTELVRELDYAMNLQHRGLRIAVPVRTSDEIDLFNVGPYVFDYGAISKLVDQVIVMAYDIHWATGNPGPIAPAKEVRRIWKFINSYGVGNVSLALPAYGYDWTVNAKGLNPTQQSATQLDATHLAKFRWKQTGSSDGETRYGYIDAGGHDHIVWEATSGLKLKKDQAWALCRCSVMVWRSGNSDPLGSALIIAALH
jgi:spore germination protein YaaH